jgi:3-carboxy-cis,cis-muconate cycloisomerase
MLRFEASLARAQASAGLIPEAAAQSIAGTCKVELFDVAKIVRESGRAGSIAIPLVKA